MTTVIYWRHALLPQQRRIEHVAACPLRDLDPAWDRPYIALRNGQPVLRRDWQQPTADDDIVIFMDAAAIPQGGGGGGSNPLNIILQIGLMAITGGLSASISAGLGFAAESFGAMVVRGAVGLIGSALVNAIAPPTRGGATTPQQASALAAPSPTYNISAQGNSARLEAAIPEQFGRMMSYPDFAAQPYVEYSGNEQYLYQLLCLGRGEYNIEALRIEDTPLSSFPDITYEVIPPSGALTLFPASVISSLEVGGQELLTATALGPFVASASATVANFLGIDLVFPRGLYYANTSGGLDSVSATVKIEAQQIDNTGAALGGWITLGTETVSGATTTPQRRSYRYALATPGRYQVRCTRQDTKQTAATYGHEVDWAGLRAYLVETRVFGDVTLIAMRMRASNNLSLQASRKVNVIATRKLPIWDGTSWSANTPTRSPAWALAYVCKQMGLTDAQIDLPTLLTLSATWATRGDTLDGRIDNFMGFWETVTKMGAAGRAKPYMQGGIMRLMRDQAASLPVALYSMRNIVKGSFNITYLMPTADTADAVDVGYFDEITWAPRRVRAALSGSTAAKPVKIDLFGVVNRDQAFREGMYQAAANRYRRKIIKFSTEMEGFIPSFGDLIAIQHDMPGWGQGGEVVGWDVPSLTATLSEPLTWATGTHYIALRRRDGSIDGPYAVTAGALPTQVIFAAAPALTPYTGGSEERTHYAFGASEAYRQPARVISVRPGSLTQVEIECVNEDANVHTAETGMTAPAPPYSSLGNYTNAPVIAGLIARSSIADVAQILLTWQPSPWADHYLIEQANSADGANANWTRVGDTSANNYSGKALYGSATKIRVAGVGLAVGPWVTVLFGSSADYMWNATTSTLMWNVTDTTLMWR